MNTHALNRSVDYIKSWLQFRYDRDEIPGYVVAIAHKGKILMNEAYGYANLETHTKLTPQHIFRIASHSKTFTATALMQMQEQGKLQIDDYVVQYLPWLREHSDQRWQKVTLRQLMSHGAGVIRDGVDGDYWSLERPFPTEDTLKKEILEQDLITESNIAHKYSNYGYSLLGMVIQMVSGLTYAEYVQKNILEPLELTQTGPEFIEVIQDAAVTGYTRRDVDKKRLPLGQVDTKAMASATGFYATSADLVRYFSAHLVGSGKLLDNESKKEMQRVQWHTKTPGQDTHEDYGLGMEIEYLGRRKVIGHGGGFPGQITQSLADPKDELVVVVLTNCIDGPAGSITKGIYGILDYYQTNSGDQVSTHDMTKFEGRFMNLWSMKDIVATGERIVSTYPDTWQPLMQPEVLEYVDGDTLKIIDAGSFASEGELVHYTFVGGSVESIHYGGDTMWPEYVWLERLRSKTIVG